MIIFRSYNVYHVQHVGLECKQANIAITTLFFNTVYFTGTLLLQKSAIGLVKFGIQRSPSIAPFLHPVLTAARYYCN